MPVRQLLLALILIAVPVGLFSAYEHFYGPAPQAAAVQASALGDMADLKQIAADTAAIVAKGDLAAAAKRITDFESAWDDQQASLQPKSPEDWGRVDGAADGAITSLRADQPDAAKVAAALVTLQATLADPTGGGATGGGVQMVAGIAVTDGSGHPLPCESMIKDVKTGLAASTMADDAKAQVSADLNAALERCNADDDTHADEHSAKALATLAGK